MKILHIELIPVDDQIGELRLFTDNPNDFVGHTIKLSDLEKRLKEVDLHYSTVIPTDSQAFGSRLYNWINGKNRLLAKLISQNNNSGCILAISASGQLADLPWEIMHDGEHFLVGQIPAVVPIRWVKSGSAKYLSHKNEPIDRALNVLFMAASPNGVTPTLDFEAEEAQILRGTRNRPLKVIVEESGNLSELGKFLSDFERNQLDVLHLSGHAEFRYGTEPQFIAESEFGDAEFVSAEDIARHLQFLLPPLIFLSCCRTAQSSEYLDVRPMAESLLRHGGNAVLGWAHLVADSSATVAAAELYSWLAAGYSLPESLALTYQSLLARKVSDWHLLRLFVNNNIPGALVKRGRKPRVRESAAPQFVDPAGKLRVATRESFVGRRRQLQRCLRHLKSHEKNLGIILHGMGGLGKSTVAARLCDRMPEWEPVVYWRVVDEPRLVRGLREKIHDPSAHDRLMLPNIKLRFRFRDALESMARPLLFVFDDFEWNLEPRGGVFELSEIARGVFEELVWALENSTLDHRIIITTRYEFDAEFLSKFEKQPLDSFKKTDLEKKLIQLSNFNRESLLEEFRDKAITLADGNPRLLEFFNDEVLSQENVGTALNKVEQEPETWKERVIWENLYAQIDDNLQKILGVMGIFEIHVPKSAVISAGINVSNLEAEFERGIKLGIIEVSDTYPAGEKRYRVPKILPKIIATIRFPGDEQTMMNSCARAASTLYDEWGRNDNYQWEEWAQIIQLLDSSKPDPLTMRQWFTKILAVQFNEESDSAFEILLQRNLPNFEIQNKCENLKELLDNQDWKGADEETAWLLLQEMVLGEHAPVSEWLSKLPNDFLNEIDECWIEASGGRFGFSVQKKLFIEKFGRAEHCGEGRWAQFCLDVGWARDNKWLSYSDCVFDIKAPIGHLPVLATARGTWSHSMGDYSLLIGDVGLTACLFGHGWRIGGREPYLFSRISGGNV